MRIWKYNINKYCLLLFITPMLISFGGISNVLKLESPHKLFNENLIVSGAKYNADDKLITIEDNTSILQLKDIDSQVKNIKLNVIGLRNKTIKASMILDAYSEKEELEIVLRNGNNIIYVPTYKQLNSIQLQIMNATNLKISSIQINSFNFSLRAFMTVLISFLIIFYGNYFYSLKFKKIYMLLVIAINYQLYWLILSHSNIRIQCIGLILTCLSQMFLRFMFQEVVTSDEQIKVE